MLASHFDRQAEVFCYQCSLNVRRITVITNPILVVLISASQLLLPWFLEHTHSVSSIDPDHLQTQHIPPDMFVSSGAMDKDPTSTSRKYPSISQQYNHKRTMKYVLHHSCRNTRQELVEFGKLCRCVSSVSLPRLKQSLCNA